MQTKLLPVAGALLAALTSSVSLAADDPLEILITTGQLRPLNVNETTSQVSVITAQQIETLQPETVNDLLKILPSFQMISKGGNGQQVDYGIRGSKSRHVLVLLDGVRVGSVTLGETALQRIPVSSIERIEVLRGPRSSVYGSDAMGGVINIITRSSYQRQANIQLTGGSNGHQDYAATYSGLAVDGRLRSTFSANYKTEKGIDAFRRNQPDKDGFEHTNALASMEYQLSNTVTLVSSLHYTQGNEEYDGWSNERTFNNSLLTAGLNYQLSTGQAQLRYSYAGQDSKESLDGLDRGEIKTTRQTLESSAWWEVLPGQILSLGGQWYRESVTDSEAYVLDNDSFDYVATPYEPESRDVGALFGRYEAAVTERLMLELGTRFENIEAVDSVWTWSGGASYRLDGYRIGASYDTAFKAPTFNDLYWPGSGNPDLAPEEARNYEVFLKDVRLGNTRMGLTWFRTDYDNLLDWKPESTDSGIWLPYNLAKADIRGVELETAWQLAGLSNWFNATLLRTEDGFGERLANRAEELASWTISGQFGNTQAALVTQYTGDRLTTSGEKLDPYTTVEVSASYPLTRQLSLRAKVANLLNADYEPAEGYNSPGRNAYLSVNYRFL